MKIDDNYDKKLTALSKAVMDRIGADNLLAATEEITESKKDLLVALDLYYSNEYTVEQLLEEAGDLENLIRYAIVFRKGMQTQAQLDWASFNDETEECRRMIKEMIKKYESYKEKNNIEANSYLKQLKRLRQIDAHKNATVKDMKSMLEGSQVFFKIFSDGFHNGLIKKLEAIISQIEEFQKGV